MFLVHPIEFPVARLAAAQAEIKKITAKLGNGYFLLT